VDVGPNVSATALLADPLLAESNMAQEWHYTIKGKEYGPVSAAELKRLATAGKLRPTDLIRNQKWKNAVRASKAEGLFPQRPAAISAMPPPPNLEKEGITEVLPTEEIAEVLPVEEELPRPVAVARRRQKPPMLQPFVKRFVLFGSQKVLTCHNCQKKLDVASETAWRFGICPHCNTEVPIAFLKGSKQPVLSEPPAKLDGKLHFQCPNCQMLLKAAQDTTGGGCPYCKQTVQVPKPEEAIRDAPVMQRLEFREMNSRYLTCECKTKIKIPPPEFGRVGKCPSCGQIIGVPLPEDKARQLAERLGFDSANQIPKEWRGINYAGRVLDVYEDKVVISPDGWLLSAVVFGTEGRMEMPYSSITGVMFSEAGWLAGHISFLMPGMDYRVKDAAGGAPANMFEFGYNQNGVIRAIKDYVQRRIAGRPAPAQATREPASVADELSKLADLLGKGHITGEEFERLKRQLLR
jgi:Zn finger protein HypA/HybF involved in hydrogenase expression